MAVECPPPGEPENGENKGHNESRQQDVRDQNGEVERSCPVVMGIGNGADRVVVDKVEGQKEGRGSQSGQHKALVAVSVHALYAPITKQEKEGTQTVEAGV